MYHRQVKIGNSSGDLKLSNAYLFVTAAGSLYPLVSSRLSQQLQQSELKMLNFAQLSTNTLEQQLYVTPIDTCTA